MGNRLVSRNAGVGYEVHTVTVASGATESDIAVFLTKYVYHSIQIVLTNAATADVEFKIVAMLGAVRG